MTTEFRTDARPHGAKPMNRIRTLGVFILCVTALVGTSPAASQDAHNSCRSSSSGDTADPAPASNDLTAKLEEADRRITAAQRQGVTELDLSELNLREIPARVFDLVGLKRLIIRGNFISTLPAQVAKLRSL